MAVDQLGDSGSGRPTVTMIPDKARTVAEFSICAKCVSASCPVAFRSPIRNRYKISGTLIATDWACLQSVPDTISDRSTRRSGESALSGKGGTRELQAYK